MKNVLVRTCALLGLIACQAGNTATISGQLVGTYGAALTEGAAAPAASRKITHVLAVDPESASPNRVLAPVTADGHFSISVNFGHPYVLVFVDATAVGTDMVVAVFKARTLDTLAPLNQGDVNLGKVSADKGVATASVAYEDLLHQLGLSADAAEYLGAIDDLSLRYANPDIDGDGVIDLQQRGHEFELDFHLRAQMRAGDGGRVFTIADLTDKFLPESGPDVTTADFTLGSIYAIYPAAYDATPYVAGDGRSLQNGAVFSVMTGDGTRAGAGSSFSPLQFADRAGWGPDYNWGTTPELELPGSDGRPVALAFTLGGSGHTLTFPNVLTRTHASLTAQGTPIPFFRLTTAGGQISAVDYKWMKRDASGSWIPSTAEELELVVGDQGAFVGLSHGSKTNRIEIKIPRQPSGSVPWSGPALAPRDICSMAASYDDKLGLRLFVGGVDPADGTSPCY